MFKNILKFAVQHKIIAGIVAIVIIGGGYYGYKAVFNKTAPPRYVIGTAQKGTLISAVAGSGQVSVSDQVDLKSKVSGDVVYVGATNGQEVKNGTLLVQLDSADAQRALNNANTDLETAKLELDQLLAPVDPLTLLQAQDSLTQAQEAKQSAEDSLANAYNDGFNSVVSAFFDLPTTMTDIDSILHSNDISKSQDNVTAYADMVRNYNEIKAMQYEDAVVTDYQNTLAAYNANFQNFKTVTRSSATATIEALINQTYDTAEQISQVFKDTDNLISFINDTLTAAGLSSPKIAATHQATIRTDTGKINTIVSNLLAIKQSIQSNSDTIVSADRTIQEKTLSFQKTQAGPDDLTIRAAKIAVQQKQDALTTAQENLSYYYIRSPFDDLVAAVNVKKGDSISGGTTVATVITKQQIANVSLNEVDVAKVKLGQKVTLTFDAIPDLSIAGGVADVDTLGTVSQGVVTYNVKIVFDTQDDRVKPGMSVSANIITDVKPDLLLVPNSAVKKQGGTAYVQVVDESIPDSSLGQSSGITLTTPPRSVAVEVGASNDTSSEILSGLKEGDHVVMRTIIAGTTATPSTQSSGALRIPGITGGGGGGGFRGGN